MKRMLLTSVILLVVACRRSVPSPVEVAMTPEVAETGVVPALIAAFERISHVTMHVRIVSAGDALRSARAADVQVVFASASQSSDYATVARLAGAFASRDFAIFGPKKDRARVASAKSTTQALQRIARRHAPFCSATAIPDLVRRERGLWAAAGVDPATLKHRSECSGDEVSVLENAERRGAYTLAPLEADAGVGRNIDIHVLWKGTPDLREELDVILVRHVPRIRRDRDAEWFVQWLMSWQGRDVVRNLRWTGR
jgi:tungstate transport system substrate-binding protein